MLLALRDHKVTTFEWGEEPPDVKGHDWVVHMGAISSTTERDVERVMRQNYDFSVELLHKCCQHGVNFQYSSSASVYGLQSEFKESSPVDPRTPYAWSKYLFERHAQQVRCRIIVQGFRYFNVYGPGEDYKGDQASPFYKFQKQQRELGYVTVFENSEQYLRDFVSVNTVCKIHMDFFDVAESGIYNVGTGKTQSFLQVAQQFSDDIRTVPMPKNLVDGYQKYTCADMTKTLHTLKKYKGDNYELG